MRADGFSLSAIKRSVARAWHARASRLRASFHLSVLLPGKSRMISSNTNTMSVMRWCPSVQTSTSVHAHAFLYYEATKFDTRGLYAGTFLRLTSSPAPAWDEKWKPLGLFKITRRGLGSRFIFNRPIIFQICYSH